MWTLSISHLYFASCNYLSAFKTNLVNKNNAFIINLQAVLQEHRSKEQWRSRRGNWLIKLFNQCVFYNLSFSKGHIDSNNLNKCLLSASYSCCVITILMMTAILTLTYWYLGLVWSSKVKVKGYFFRDKESPPTTAYIGNTFHSPGP